MSTLANSSTKIQNIVESGYCSGCGICQSIAPQGTIEIKFSKSGYLRPYVTQPLSATVIAEVQQVCPGVNIRHHKRHEKYHTIWGPYRKISTGYALNERVRYHGSSGGVISALAIHLLESNKVAFVAQNAVSKDNPLQNALQLSRNAEDVIHAAGSRYAPSSPLQAVHQLFDSGEKFAFIGKPCDVAGLRNYLHAHPHLKPQVPYMISFMCAGIPSQKGTNAILEHFMVKPEDVKTMRYRGEGWPGKAKVETEDGSVHEMDYETSWGTILNKHLQFRCKICPDGTGEFADIVCADAWYGKDGYPDFEEQAGRSLIIARTHSGEALIDDALRQAKVNITSLPIEEIAKMQPYQLNRKSVVLGRLLASWLVNRHIPRYKQLSLLKASFQVSFIEWLRSAWGTYKRIKKEV